jgi:hypothetical protein
VFQNSLNELPVFDEADDPHDPPTSPLSRGQALGRSGDRPSPTQSGTGSDLLDQPGPVFPVFLRTFIGFQDAGAPVVFGFFPFSAALPPEPSRIHKVFPGP